MTARRGLFNCCLGGRKRHHLHHPHGGTSRSSPTPPPLPLACPSFPSGTNLFLGIMCLFFCVLVYVALGGLYHCLSARTSPSPTQSPPLCFFRLLPSANKNSLSTFAHCLLAYLHHSWSPPNLRNARLLPPSPPVIIPPSFPSPSHSLPSFSLPHYITAKTCVA